MENESQVKIKFIGTGSAKVYPKRFFTSFILSNSTTNLLIDCGDGISKRLAELEIDLNSIENILITHLHPDHFTGIASLLVQMKLSNREKNIKIFIHKNLVEFLELFFERVYLFKERFPFEYEIISYNFNDKIEIGDKFNFLAKPNSHLEKYSYSFINNSECLVSPSFLFEINNKKIYYSSDVGKAEDLNLFNSDYKISISETTHINLQELNFFIEKDFAEKYFLVHIEEKKEELLKENFRDKILKGKVFIPNDGDEYLI